MPTTPRRRHRRVPTACDPNQQRPQTKTTQQRRTLSVVARDLKELDYRVETGKRREDKVTVPVLFGRNGEVEKSFDADAYNKNQATVIEVEAARTVTGNQFLKDLFQASMMEGVKYCVIAVRNRSATSKDFDTVCRFMDTMYASDRLRLPLDGILVLGY